MARQRQRHPVDASRVRGIQQPFSIDWNRVTDRSFQRNMNGPRRPYTATEGLSGMLQELDEIGMV